MPSCLAPALSIVWSKARAGLTLAGEFCNLLGQGIALGLDHFTSGGQLGGFALGLHQAALDLSAGLGGCALDLGGNGTGSMSAAS